MTTSTYFLQDVQDSTSMPDPPPGQSVGVTEPEAPMQPDATQTEASADDDRTNKTSDELTACGAANSDRKLSDQEEGGEETSCVSTFDQYLTGPGEKKEPQNVRTSEKESESSSSDNDEAKTSPKSAADEYSLNQAGPREIELEMEYSDSDTNDSESVVPGQKESQGM